MKAITTKFLPCTNTRGARLKAFDSDNNQVTISYPHECNNDEAHLKAAQALCDKMGWCNPLHSGGIKGGMVHVMI